MGSTSGDGATTTRFVLVPAGPRRRRALDDVSAAGGAQCACSAPPAVPHLVALDVLEQHEAAGLERVAWTCGGDGRRHTRWQLRDGDGGDDNHKKKNNTTGREATWTPVSDSHGALGRPPRSPAFEVEHPRLSLFVSRTMGRVAVAREAMERGTCVMRAAAFAVVVRDDLEEKHTGPRRQRRRRRCHWCLGHLVTRAVRCGGCEFALYCDRACMERDRVLHEPQCPALRELIAESRTRTAKTNSSPRQDEQSTGGIDTETQRLVLAVLSMEQWLGTTAPLARLHLPTPMSSKKSAAQACRRRRAAAAGLHRWLQASAELRGIPVSHIEETLHRVQANAHPLFADGALTPCGLGLFPDAAMTLNHSCAPTVVPGFDPTTRTLNFYTVEAIPRLGLVEYSYIADPLVRRRRRRATLREGFGFECCCRRCREEEAPGDDEEIEDSEGEQERVLGEFMRAQHGATFEALRQKHHDILRCNADMAFSVTMIEMHTAAEQRRWEQVADSVQTLLDLWEDQGLPRCHPMTAMLHQQLCQAATMLGNRTLLERTTSQLEEIKRVCGIVA